MKLVQITPWRDLLIGLTDTGEVWKLSPTTTRNYGAGEPDALVLSPPSLFPGFPEEDHACYCTYQQRFERLEKAVQILSTMDSAYRSAPDPYRHRKLMEAWTAVHEASR